MMRQLRAGCQHVGLFIKCTPNILCKSSRRTGGAGWADVWKRHHFAWEYKGKRADLDAAFDQLRQYCQRSPEKSVILDRTSTTTCRGCMSEHRRQEPVWTSVRGAGVKAVSPAERGRSEATRLDVGEHTRTLLA